LHDFLHESGLVTSQELAGNFNAKNKKYLHKLPGAGKYYEIDNNCHWR